MKNICNKKEQVENKKTMEQRTEGESNIFSMYMIKMRKRMIELKEYKAHDYSTQVRCLPMYLNVTPMNKWNE